MHPVGIETMLDIILSVQCQKMDENHDNYIKCLIKKALVSKLLNESYKMLINSKGSVISNPITNIELSSLLKKRASMIKDKSFQISINDNDNGKFQVRPSAKKDSISNMFTKLTKKMKNQLKQQKNKSKDTSLNNSSMIVGKPLIIFTKQMQMEAKLSQSLLKAESSSQRPFHYADFQFKSKLKLSGVRNRNKSRDASRDASRKSTLSNFNQRIWKGSTVSRLSYEQPNKRKSVSKVKTEAQFAPDFDSQFVPLGNKFMNQSSRVLKNTNIYPLSPPESSNRQDLQQQQPLKQIYNKIFVRYPNRPNFDNIRQRTSRNMRRLYSSYKMSHERQKEKEKEKEKGNEKDNKKEGGQDDENDDKNSKKNEGNMSNKQVCVSQKNIYSRVREKRNEEVGESLSLGSVLGPWGNEKV